MCQVSCQELEPYLSDKDARERLKPEDWEAAGQTGWQSFLEQVHAKTFR